MSLLGVGGGVVWNKPKTSIVCYCCGREFFKESIKIHIPQCEALWIKREALKPPKERRPLPKPPTAVGDFKDASSIKQWNDAAYENYYEKGRLECPHCNRKFAPDVAERHIPRCANIQNRPKPPPQSAASPSTARPSTAAAAQHYSSPASAAAAHNAFDSTPLRSSSDSSPLSPFSAPADFPSSDSSSLVPCSLCNRHFAADRIQVHERACRKHHEAEAKRAAKSEKARPKTSVAPSRSATASSPGSGSGSGSGSGASSWKSQHSEFIAAIRYGKELSKLQKSGVNLATLPPPPPSANPDYVSCPSCGRRFAPDVAARHIPKCANIINKPKPPPQSISSSSASSSRSTALPSISPSIKSPRTARSVTFSSSPNGLSPPPSSSAAPAAHSPRSPGLNRPLSSARARPVKSPSSVSPVPSSAGPAQSDLHDKINQLQATVAALSSHVQQFTNAAPSPPSAAPSRSPASPALPRTCRSCGETNPAKALFCCFCAAKM